MKKFATFLMCILLAACFVAMPAAADANPNSNMVLLSENVIHIDESTFYIERIYIPEISPYSNVRTGTKTTQCVHNGSLVFAVSVTGQFTYDGVSARATSASGAVSRYVANASVSSSNAYTSGASAIASASVSYLGATLSRTVTLTCDANGNLS